MLLLDSHLPILNPGFFFKQHSIDSRDKHSRPLDRLKLDWVVSDWKILTELQENARLDNAGLAEKVNLSPCLARVRRQERDGFIRRYVPLLDPKSVGLRLTEPRGEGTFTESVWPLKQG